LLHAAGHHPVPDFLVDMSQECTVQAAFPGIGYSEEAAVAGAQSEQQQQPDTSCSTLFAQLEPSIQLAASSEAPAADRTSSDEDKDVDVEEEED
jgi:hypothetical protein